MTTNPTQHTPGPWRVHIPRKDFREMFPGCDTGIEILAELHNSDGTIGGYQVVVGYVNCDHRKRILTKADATLIAAAPELLDACKAGLESAVNLLEITDGEGYPGLEDAISTIRAAIRKAEGK